MEQAAWCSMKQASALDFSKINYLLSGPLQMALLDFIV